MSFYAPAEERGGYNRLRIVKLGSPLFEPGADERYVTMRALLRVGGGSTVSLIETASGERILVDTGFDREWDTSRRNLERNAVSLAAALNSIGMGFDDVDVVFLTHHHLDHAGNLHLFRSARLMGHPGLEDRFPGLRGVEDGEEIAPGVLVIHTPGHVRAHASIVVEARLSGMFGFYTVTHARVAIAGDAIVSESWLRAGRPYDRNPDFHSIEEARRSAEKILEVTDVIIPGHGHPFIPKSLPIY